jgi:hypothetical protein
MINHRLNRVAPFRVLAFDMVVESTPDLFYLSAY